MAGTEAEVRKVIHDLLEAWQEKRFEDMYHCFHPEIVVMDPSLSASIKGRQACLMTFVEFSEEATIKEFSAFDYQISVWAQQAVASYKFAITYVMGGNLYRETGHDILVLVKQVGGWKLLWRAMVNNERI